MAAVKAKAVASAGGTGPEKGQSAFPSLPENVLSTR